MTRKRLALVALCIGLTAIAVPAGVQAQKVANPGQFLLQSYQQGVPLSLFKIGNKIPVQYLSADVSISGSIDAGGNITIPQNQVAFPAVPVDLAPYGLQGLVNVTLSPTAAATGTLDPITRQLELSVKVRALVTGVINGVQLNPGCAVGTVANPISLNLRTSGAGSASYNPTTGRAVLVDDSFAVPGASGCGIPGLFGSTIDLNPALNEVIGLPSSSGLNRIVLEGRTLPALQPGIVANITMSTATPVANQSIGFSAATSSVTKTPATYAWEFSDGATATGPDVQHTFTSTGPQSARLTITDADGDTATRLSSFIVGQGTTTTSTTSTTSTTTTQPTTTTSTTSTTTTQPTTTTSTTSTTTTQPTTTTSTTTTQPTTTTSTTTTQPTTTTSTTTTQPTTTTSTTTTQPTTTTSTTTTQPTTTTSTTLPPSNDAVSVKLSGAVDYENAGSGTGDVTVTNDSFGIRTVSGTLQIPGTNGGTSRVDVDVQRAWILPLWTGQVSVRDAGASVSVAAPVFGQISRGATATSAKGTLGWFQLGQFPNLIRPYTLSWSVTDAG